MQDAISLVAVVGLVVIGGTLLLVTRRAGLPVRTRGRSTEDFERSYLAKLMERHEADLREQGYTDEDIAKELQKKRDDLVKLAPELGDQMRGKGYTDAQIEHALRVLRESLPDERAGDPYAPT